MGDLDRTLTWKDPLMAIGNDPDQEQLNVYAAVVAQAWAAVARQTLGLQNYVSVKLGQSGLVAKGFTADDASTLITMCNYMGTLAGVYGGTATQPSQFDFADALVTLTGPFVT